MKKTLVFVVPTTLVAVPFATLVSFCSLFVFFSSLYEKCGPH